VDEIKTVHKTIMQILNDFNTSVRKALGEIDPDWEKYEGLIICGTHSPEKLDPNQQIGFIRMARERGLPFLGICFGHQLAAIEYARNVLGIKNATSEEFGEGELVVQKLPNLKVGLFDGESYWNNYEVISDIIAQWQKPENFITCQYHPEYQSNKDKPHPLLVKFLEICRTRK
jgi:CTP synthase (UTP-ammonia lyase)